MGCNRAGAGDGRERSGKVQPLGRLSPGPGLVWDSAANGKRFLATAGKSGSEPYTVVLNPQAGLKK
jgi:hypothetical protein